jgi:hypothetical protein
MLRDIGVVLVITVLLYVVAVNDGFASFCNDCCDDECKNDYLIVNKFNVERDYHRE